MVRHNNVIPNQHFHKDWQNRVKTWFDQVHMWWGLLRDERGLGGVCVKGVCLGRPCS